MQLLKIKMGKVRSCAVKLLVIAYVLFAALVGSADYVVPDEITVTRDEINKVSAYAEGIGENVTVKAKLFGTFPIKTVKVNVIEQSRLVPCGQVFGVKFFTKGVMVVKMTEIETKDGAVSPAQKAGIAVGDIIETIDGTNVNTVEEMAEIVENSRGKDLAVTYLRDGKISNCVMKPLLSLSDKKYKTGIWVRDSTAGIGTMTYYNPDTGEFAGLGHGICDVDTGLLMPLLEASVVDVDITDIIKGRRGSPGELKGQFDRVKNGYITRNTPRGIYGVMDKDAVFSKESMPIGFSHELVEGTAHILCELDDEGIKEYEISITKINGNAEKDKNFVIEVTDERLVEKTGGIVQGMSGSPIIQNGKLVGAVTHVLVNNPKKGYGIFIENMLNQNELS